MQLRSVRQAFRTVTALAVLLAVSFGFAGPAQAQQKSAKKQDSKQKADKPEKPEHEYIRIRKNDKNLAVALETSIITFEGSNTYPNAKVDLIGAIHLGEPEYYQQLNELFEKYDVLLFEAVMPEDAVKQDLRPGGGEGARRKPLTDEEEWTDAKVGFTAISVLQVGMKDALGMEFQLTGVDYTKDNFVHADMTAEEFEASMKERGESFSGMMLNEMGKSMAAQQKQNPLAMNLDMMMSALSSDPGYRMRRIFAVQLAKGGEGDAFASFDGASTIITERNKKCLSVMERELKNGHKNIGIFYGAGHFADMEKRMVNEHGFKRKGEEWIVAWHLRDPKEDTGKKPASK
ncbi:MAG: hypothetical protein JNM43_28635 [Planctomycetaceae bacterium]|nr:hypothetical protein [Planctomycetaceae bacterium]